MKLSKIKIIVIMSFALLFSVAASAQTQPDRALKVTKNRPAEYTGEARARMLEGWIKLRVTFLDTGEIGDIFYVDESDAEKNLSKYGLLKNSYEAAKKIEFLPAIKDGKPVTVTKVLLYNFSLGRNPGGFKVGRP